MTFEPGIYACHVTLRVQAKPSATAKPQLLLHANIYLNMPSSFIRNQWFMLSEAVVSFLRFSRFTGMIRSELQSNPRSGFFFLREKAKNNALLPSSKYREGGYDRKLATKMQYSLGTASVQPRFVPRFFF